MNSIHAVPNVAGIAFALSVTASLALSGPRPVQDIRPAPRGAAPETVIGTAIPIGCATHDPRTAAAACARTCLKPERELALRAGNGEVYLLHGISADARKQIAAAPVGLAVTGTFAWQGAFRTLAVESVRPATEDELAQAATAAARFEMTSYYLVILRPGPRAAEITPEERQKLMTGHFQHIQTQSAAGRLRLAGPFGKQPGEKRLSGLYVYAVDSIADAEALNAGDAAIAAGYFAAETIPWHGPKSLSW